MAMRSDRGQGGDARLVQRLQGSARLPPLLGRVSASLPRSNKHVLGQAVVIRRGSITIVKLPFSIRSAGIFLGVYFWQRAVSGAGRARGEGKRNGSDVAAWEQRWLAGGGLPECLVSGR